MQVLETSQTLLVMFRTIAFITALAMFAVLPAAHAAVEPIDVSAPIVGEVCSPIPAVPIRESVHPFADTRADGAAVWGAEATYRLSSGDVGEVWLAIDSEGAGEAMLLINGDIVAHVEVAIDDAAGEPVLTTWVPSELDYPPEVIAEMVHVDLPGIVAESIPQEFKCSPFGRKVMKAGKYFITGALTAVGAACCIATQTIACPLCAGAAGVGILAGQEFADGYCD